jgi:hypothetical protein
LWAWLTYLNLHGNLLCIHPISSDADADRSWIRDEPWSPALQWPPGRTADSYISSLDSYAHADANRSKLICRSATSFSKGVWFPRLELNWCLLWFPGTSTYD